MSARTYLSGLLAAGLLTSPAAAQVAVDYFGQVTGQLGAVRSEFTLAPLSTFTYASPGNPELVGRFFGRLDVVPWTETELGRFGLHSSIFSNLNTAYDHRRGLVPFDSHRFNLTRLRPETPLDFDRLHFFHDGPYGRFELGWVVGVSERTAVTAPLAWGVGSVGGDYPYFLDKPLDVGFHTLTAYGSGNYSPRVAWFSPRVYGFELGVSYQPDTRNTGFDFVYGGPQMGVLGRRPNTDFELFTGGLPVGIKSPPKPLGNGSYEGHTAGFRDVVEAGLRSEHRFGDFRLAASLAGIAGTAIESPFGTPFNDLKSFQAGVQLGYGGWTIGGGYVWAGDSGYGKHAFWRQRLSQYSAHVGVQYETGRWTFGAAFLNSDDAGDPTERSDRQLWVYSAGLRYRLTDDLDVGAEVNRIRPLSADFGDYEVYTALAQIRYRFGGSLR